MYFRHFGRSLLLAFVLSMMIGAVPIRATGVVVEPAFQFITLSNEQNHAEIQVRLTNQTDSSQVFKLSTIDIRQLDEAGRIGLVDKPIVDSQYALAQYLQLAETQIELTANETREVVVKVQNSISLSPGGHYGAVLAEVVSSGSEGEQVVVPAVSAIILVHKVGGELFHLNLKRIILPDIWFALPKSVQLQFENHGNVHVIPRGQVMLIDMLGRRVAEGTINEGSLVVMPETQRMLSVMLAPRAWAIPFVPLTLQVSGSTDLGNLQFSQSAIVGYLPLVMMFVITVGLIVVIHFVRRYVAKKR